jgi:hypothetical protein
MLRWTDHFGQQTHLRPGRIENILLQTISRKAGGRILKAMACGDGSGYFLIFHDMGIYLI